MPAVATELDPPGFLQLAGHPLRWRLLSELGRSDRSVGELTARVDEAQNLVSYHLAKLRNAKLVNARQSSADGRDTYYAADLAMFGALLGETGSALHPSLRLVPPPLELARLRRKKPRVLFLCTGNSSRSQMAEAFARGMSHGLVDAASAGSNPKPLHPLAIDVMREEHGIDIAAQRTKHLDKYSRRRFDQVVTLCDRVREVCPDFPSQREPIHWSIPDPAAEGDGENYAAFERTAAELEARVGYLLARLSKEGT